jgi:hypothetical protein
MTYDTMRIRYLMNSRRALATLVISVVACFAASAVFGQDVDLVVRLPEQPLLAGEPVLLTVELHLKASDSSLAYATSKRFFEVAVFDSSGEQILEHAGSKELVYEVGEGSPWLKESIILDQDSPIWSTTVSVRERFDLTVPGSYEIVAIWNTPTISPSDRSRELEALSKRHPDNSPLRLLEGFHREQRQVATLVCPTSHSDRAAYQEIAGGTCPDAQAGNFLLGLDTAIAERLIADYHTSRYIGYVLVKGVGAYPYSRILKDWADKNAIVGILGSGSFLSDHPEVVLVLDIPIIEEGELVKTEKTASEPLVQAHYSLLTTFLGHNQDFMFRDKLEMMAALDSLTLGKTDEAYTRWNWVAANSHVLGRRRSASEYLLAMETTGLVSR